MANQGTTSFDLGHHSMLRMIRSARSRLGRERSNEDVSKTTGSAAVAADKPPRAPSMSRSTFARRRLSRSSGVSQCKSENVAPEKSLQKPGGPGGVLSDVTNTEVMPNDAQASQQDSNDKPKGGVFSITGQNSVWHDNASNRGEVLKLDIQNADNPQHVVEYLPDIMRELFRSEKIYMSTPGYMACQANVNAKMRGILVDWLISVQQKYKLKSETVFLAVAIIDSYLSVRAIQRKHLQLVGITSLLISAKFEEIYPPHVKDFVYVTDNAYTKEDIAKMEVLILGALNFQVCRPTAVQFFERYQAVNGCDATHKDLAQYLLELSLVDYDMIKYSPSHSAAAAVLLSNKLLQHPAWSQTLLNQTNLTEQELKQCTKDMYALFEHAEHSSLQAVRKKFSNAKYHSVASLTLSGPQSTISPLALGDKLRSNDGRGYVFGSDSAFLGA